MPTARPSLKVDRRRRPPQVILNPGMDGNKHGINVPSRPANEMDGHLASYRSPTADRLLYRRLAVLAVVAQGHQQKHDQRRKQNRAQINLANGRYGQHYRRERSRHQLPAGRKAVRKIPIAGKASSHTAGTHIDNRTTLCHLSGKQSGIRAGVWISMLIQYF